MPATSFPATGAGRPTRGHKKRERTRRLLLEAGTRALAAKGEALTVNDVVTEAEVSTGTFYNYFTDRDDLLDRLAEHSVAVLVDDMAATITDDDPARRFARATAGVLRRAHDDPTWARAVLRLADRPRSLDVEISRHLRADIADGHETGRFTLPPDDVTLDLLLGLITSSIRRIVRDESDPGRVEAVLARGLTALGIDPDEAQAIAADATP